MTIEDIEPDIRFLCMLSKIPAAMRNHRDLAVMAFIDCSALYHQRHVIEVGMAVANKENAEGVFHCHLLLLLIVHGYHPTLLSYYT
ncbi:MAG: hypothetical protein IKH57_17170 [Clostridia bacterium]|nr:hypothetical protein [Clostridia bacterium]